jgi:hypothetical protein
VATARTGWAPFNAGSISIAESPALAGATTLEAIASADGDGAYADISGLVPGRSYDVSVSIRGSAGEVVTATAESPFGTVQAYLGSGQITLRRAWQRAAGVVTAGATGQIRVVVASQSEEQTFYIAARRVVPQRAAAIQPATGPPRRQLASVPSLISIAAPSRTAEGMHTAQSAIAAAGEGFDATIPFKMLVSEHRGLFLWTPLCAFAALGYLLAVARMPKASARRRALVTLLVAALALLCSHVFWRQWDGGFAFSQRFLSGLFPLYLIGVAELVRRARLIAYPLLTLCALFAVSIAFVHDIGYDGISERDGLSRHVEAGWENRHQMRLDVQDDATARWAYLWGLLEGRDSKCINEPPGTTEC